MRVPSPRPFVTTPLFSPPHLPELALSGLDYYLADMRGAANPRRDMEDFRHRFSQERNLRELSSFNYEGSLG